MPYINWLQGNLRFVDKMNFYCLWLAEKNRRTVARGKLIGAQVAARVAGRQVVKDSRACVIMWLQLVSYIILTFIYLKLYVFAFAFNLKYCDNVSEQWYLLLVISRFFYLMQYLLFATAAVFSVLLGLDVYCVFMQLLQ